MSTITDKERMILFKDLCGRVPYDLVVRVEGLGDVYLAGMDWWQEVGVKDNTNTLYPLDEVKPYLRPMSSMTLAEKIELKAITKGAIQTIGLEDIVVTTDEGFDWLNEHRFDHRGLIPKGLALEEKEGMYKD